MAKNNKDNFQEYLKKTNRHNLPIPDHDESIQEMIDEGFKLLAQEEKLAKKESPKKDPPKPIAPTPSNNPYVQARTQILAKWNADPNFKWRATEIQEMESGKLPKTKHYDDFVKEVAILGDKISNKA